MQQIEKYPDRADLNNLKIRKIITKISLSHHRGEEKVGALPRTRKKSLSALHDEKPLFIGTRCEHQMQGFSFRTTSTHKTFALHLRRSTQQASQKIWLAALLEINLTTSSYDATNPRWCH